MMNPQIGDIWLYGFPTISDIQEHFIVTEECIDEKHGKFYRLLSLEYNTETTMYINFRHDKIWTKVA